MGNIGNMSRRFFHPAAIEEMLTTFVPLINGTDLDVCYLRSSYHSYANWITECPCLSILSPKLSTLVSSDDVPSHVVPSVGVHELV